MENPRLDLLQRIYEDTENRYSLKDAKEKARMFYDTAKKIATRQELCDWWVQISENWDLNVWDADVYGDGTKSGMQLTLYPARMEADGYSHTDVSRPKGLTMWS